MATNTHEGFSPLRRNRTVLDRVKGFAVSPFKIFLRTDRSVPTNNDSQTVISLGDDDFARFTECMTKPATPTKAMLEAAELHRKLRSR